jgi:hypothetical protein
MLKEDKGRRRRKIEKHVYRECMIVNTGSMVGGKSNHFFYQSENVLMCVTIRRTSNEKRKVEAIVFAMANAILYMKDMKCSFSRVCPISR